MDASEANVALVRAIYDRYSTGDIEFLFGVSADDILWSSSGLPHRFPTATKRQGKEAVRDFFDLLRKDWTVEVHDPQEFIGQGERVVVRTHVRVRNNETGKYAEFEKADLLTVRDGRVQSFQEIFDSAHIELCLPA